ncbi:MAG: protein translocase subunit SecF [Steroidobacteraceae bacterium]
MEFFKKTPRIPFMGKRTWCYGFSTFLMVATLVLLLTRGLNFGIDFTGGVVLELAYPDTADLDKARAAVSEAGFPEAQIQNFGTSRDIMVRVLPREGEDVVQIATEITDALRAVQAGIELRRTEVVGPQVGEELTEQGGLAMLFTFILILVYIGFRFEKKMGVSAVIAAIHDPIVILGFFALTQMQFDLSVLAAILAVIGYSINDTVVVFDRVREVFLASRKKTSAEMIDSAVNETLSRTVMTSVATLIVVAALFIFGGEALKGFSAAILVGVVIGTYSSIFVAGALALDMKLKPTDLMPPVRDDKELDAIP